MIVRVDISNLNEIENKLKKGIRKTEDIKDSIHKRDIWMKPYIKGSKGIASDLDKVYFLSKKIDEDTEALRAVLRDFIYQAEILVYGDNAHQTFIEWLYNQGKEVWDKGSEVVETVIDEALGVIEEGVENYFRFASGVAQWIVDNKDVIWDIVVDVAIIATGIAIIFFTGGSAAVIIGGIIIAGHATMDLAYDVAALATSDPDEKERLMNKGAQDMYIEALGETVGPILFATMELTAIVCTLGALGSINGIQEAKYISRLKGAIKFKNIIKVANGFFTDYELDPKDLLKVLLPVELGEPLEVIHKIGKPFVSLINDLIIEPNVEKERDFSMEDAYDFIIKPQKIAENIASGGNFSGGGGGGGGGRGF